MDGLDTGFFFALRDGEDEPKTLWMRIIEGDQPAAVSSVTIFELLRHGYVGRLDRPSAEKIVGSAGMAFEHAGVDPTHVLQRAARITHGMGLSMAGDDRRLA
jgi:predicted nucleic acid-binding protein